MAAIAASAAVYQSDSGSRDVMTQPSSALYAACKTGASLHAPLRDGNTSFRIARSIAVLATRLQNRAVHDLHCHYVHSGHSALGR